VSTARPAAGNGRDPSSRTFRAADDFAVAIFHVCKDLRRSGGAELAAEMRRAAARCGAAVVRACAVRGGDGELDAPLQEARDRLLDARYHLHLARRLGLIEAVPYRRAAGSHESALRAVESWLRTRSPKPP
jgi:hypothetical protein